VESIHIKAHAKINIALDVVGKRADGYHELKTVMQTLRLHDNLHIKKVREKGVRLVCNKDGLPVDERNLAHCAADYMLKAFGLDEGVSIELEKNIPISAGLAGGSSDCAAVLVGMRDLFGLPLSLVEMAEIGKQFGADVPYCIMGGTMLAEGIGEKLTPLPPLPKAYVLLAKPPFDVSTQKVFSNFCLESCAGDTNFDILVDSIENGNLAVICSQMKNMLESVTIGWHGEIAELKNEMLANGAVGSLMSGSGPTVFGLFEDESELAAADLAVKMKFPNMEIIETEIFNPNGVN